MKTKIIIGLLIVAVMGFGLIGMTGNNVVYLQDIEIEMEIPISVIAERIYVEINSNQ